MNDSSRTNKTLTTIATTLFVAATVIPSHAAVSEFGSVEPSVSGPGIFLEANPTAPVSEPAFEVAFGNSATAAVVKPLNDALRECRGLGEYAASCAAAAYKKAARAASKPDYRDARRELSKAAKKLDRLVSANADRKAPKKKGKFGSYKAVKKEAVAKVNREAIKIIQETETKLLRSSGSGNRKVHYQKIAKAVGSTKVIFRS